MKMTPPTCVFASLCWVLATAACNDDAPQPIGEPNPGVAVLAANDWMSADTITTIDPQTGEETVNAYTSDLRPDTLRDGTIVYKVATHMPVLASCVADEEPLFCTQVALQEFARANLRYPREAVVAGLEGSGIATFVIGANGKVRTTGVERSLGDVLDQEMLRLVGTLPAWHPGFYEGKAVAVRYRLPITFTLPTE